MPKLSDFVPAFAEGVAALEQHTRAIRQLARATEEANDIAQASLALSRELVGQVASVS